MVGRMSTDPRPLSEAEAAEQLPPGWRVEDAHLRADYRTGSMVRGLAFVADIVAAAEALNHHPDLDFRYGTVGLSLTTHDVGGLTEADVRLARQIADLASVQDLSAE